MKVFCKTIIIIVVQMMIFCQLSCFVYLAAGVISLILAGIRLGLLSVSHVRESSMQPQIPGHVPKVIRDMGLAVASFDRAHEPGGGQYYRMGHPDCY